MLLGGAVLLAFAIGVARGILDEPAERAPEPEPPPAPAAAAPRAEAPPEPAPLGEPRAAPADPRREAAPADPRREAVRARLARDLAAHFPDRKLSSDEIDAAADALMRLRAARLELNELPRTAENAERIRSLTREIGEAYEDFEYVVELDPAEFTERVDPGVDADDEEEAPE
jgi:hypothetical protein